MRWHPQAIVPIFLATMLSSAITTEGCREGSAVERALTNFEAAQKLLS